MTAAKSRFTNLAQAVKDRTAETAISPSADQSQRPVGAGVHKPVAALGAVGEAVRDRIKRLEAELADAGTTNAGLAEELSRVKALRARVGDAVEEFLYIEAENIFDRLPHDRLRGGIDGREFDELLEDIRANGQNDAITVRRTAAGAFEVAAGRRRLEACRRLDRSVLARVRELDDHAMLRVQFSENERRADISALERARWFLEVRDRLRISAKEIATQFGVDPSTFSLYLRLARFPAEILDRLKDPKRLAVLPARRIMEAIEADAGTVRRILDALETYDRRMIEAGAEHDPAAQIEVLTRSAEGRGSDRSGTRFPVPERRHIVHQGRRIGTLTRNGGQWVFRFATSIPDIEVQVLAERLAVPVTEPSDGGPVPRGMQSLERERQ